MFLAFETGLRGRPLNGVISKLPDNQIGLVIEEVENNSSYKATGSFKQLYSWQLDEPNVSLANDPFTSTLKDWFKISEIVSYFYYETATMEMEIKFLFLSKIYRFMNEMLKNK